MLVSIIVPFYNVEPYLRRCLDSIVNQTYRNLEIILVNDCSPDNCIVIAREYAAKDERIVIIEHEKNLGVAGARNSGLAVAKGEYVWFIDSDDELVFPYAIEHLVMLAHRDQAQVIFLKSLGLEEKSQCMHWRTRRSEELVFNENFPFLPAHAKALVEDPNYRDWAGAVVWNKFFKRSFIQEHNFNFIDAINEDTPSAMLVALATRVTFCPLPFYSYLSRSSSLSSSKPHNYIEHVRAIAQQMRQIYEQSQQNSETLTLILAIEQQNYLIWALGSYLGKSSKAKHNTIKLSWYALMQEVLGPNNILLTKQTIPNTLAHHTAWLALLASFEQKISQGQQLKLINNILYGQTWYSPQVKKIVKMLLPYGVIRYIQIRKKKENK